MLSADVVFSLLLCGKAARKAPVFPATARRGPTYQSWAVEDTTKNGIKLHNAAVSPAVLQSGPVAVSQPNVFVPDPVGAGVKGLMRLKGTPLIAKKGSIKVVTAADRLDVVAVSPMVTMSGLF